MAIALIAFAWKRASGEAIEARNRCAKPSKRKIEKANWESKTKKLRKKKRWAVGELR